MNNDTNINSNNFVQVATVTTLFYSMATGVSPGTTYQFKITATNGRGTSLQSLVGAALAASVPA
jgi:hypothetical protein